MKLVLAVVHAMEFSGLSYNLEKDSRPSIAQTSKRWTLHPELQQLVNFDSDSIDVIRRKPLTEEIKHTIFMEQKLFSIQRKVLFCISE